MQQAFWDVLDCELSEESLPTREALLEVITRVIDKHRRYLEEKIGARPSLTPASPPEDEIGVILPVDRRYT